MCVSEGGGVVHYARQTKVAQLYVLLFVQKDVRWLQVSMQDLALFHCVIIVARVSVIVNAVIIASASVSGSGKIRLVTVVAFIQGQEDLREDLPNDILGYIVLLLFSFL